MDFPWSAHSLMWVMWEYTVLLNNMVLLNKFISVQHSLVRIYEKLRKYEKLRNNGISAGKHITLCGNILY